MQQQRVRKTFTYQLVPTPEQERTLETVVWRCRELYNAGLQERTAAWETCRVSVSFAMQSAQLPAIKEVRPDYRDLNAQALQDVLVLRRHLIADRLSRATKASGTAGLEQQRCSVGAGPDFMGLDWPSVAAVLGPV